MKDGDYTSFTVQPLYAADGETVVMYLVEFKPHGFYFVTYEYSPKFTLVLKMYKRDIERAPNSKEREWSRYRYSEEQPEDYGNSVWIRDDKKNTELSVKSWYESDGESVITYVDSPYTIAGVSYDEKKYVFQLKNKIGEKAKAYIPAIKVGDEYLNLMSMQTFKYDENLTYYDIESFHMGFIAFSSFNL